MACLQNVASFFVKTLNEEIRGGSADTVSTRIQSCLFALKNEIPWVRQGIYFLYAVTSIYELLIDFTPASHLTDEQNTIVVELEWCRMHHEHTDERPPEVGTSVVSLGPISAPSEPGDCRDIVSLGEPERSHEKYLWYETYPAKLKKSRFVFHYMSKGE